MFTSWIILSDMAQGSKTCSDNTLCQNVLQNQLVENILNEIHSGNIRYNDNVLEDQPVHLGYQDLSNIGAVHQELNDENKLQQIINKRLNPKFRPIMRKGKGRKFCPEFSYIEHRTEIANEKNNDNAIFADANLPTNYDSLTKSEQKTVKKKLRRCNNKYARAKALAKQLEEVCKKKVIITDMQEQKSKVDTCAEKVREEYENIPNNATMTTND
ncbi:hypothetical protein BDAP_002521 [Binucleata daphniae]